MKSWIEISAAQLKENFASIQAVAGNAIDVLGVIKADAYGHGAALCAPVLAEAGAAWRGVGDREEGVRVRESLRKAGIADEAARVLVMCGFEPADAPGMVDGELTPVIWTAAHVQVLERAAAQAGVRVAVHLEIDSGMARQGAAPGSDLATVLDALWQAPHVRCEGIFSHLSSSEVVRSVQTAMQSVRFEHAVEQVLGRGIIPELLHLGNSSALDEGWTLPWVRERARKSVARALVRPGLALYGYLLPLSPGDSALVREGSLQPQLQPVATWKTHVVGTRLIPAGTAVGYGASFVASERMRLALLPVGYADGFRREASSGLGDGWVIIGGQRAPVVGRVSMNLTIVDVTGHPAVQEGNEVVLLGRGVTGDDHARWCGTIPYEILCGMRGHRRLV